MSYHSEGDTSPTQSSITQLARQSTMEAGSSRQNEDKICYKFKYVQPDDHLTIKEYVDLIDSELPD